MAKSDNQKEKTKEVRYYVPPKGQQDELFPSNRIIEIYNETK